MSCAELLVELRNLGARLWLEDDRLRISAPRGVLTEEMRRDLKSHRDEILELLKRQSNGQKPRPPLTRRARPERLPLSHAQQRLWFLYRMEGATATYNITAALRLDGELDKKSLELALGDVVARHEVLRTVFYEQDGTPYQRVLVPEEARMPLVIQEVREEQLAECLATAAASKIELEHQIPLRTWLFCLGARSHVLLFLLHHIAGDGWSMAPLSRDVEQAYRARIAGQAPQFDELPLQYADYALWQRELLGDKSDSASVMAKETEFWRTTLQGAPEELNLPVDRRRASVASYRGAVLPVHLDAELHRSLLAFAHKSGASLFMVLQAIWAALLWRVGAGKDIPIGTVVAGRDEPALEGLIGFFLNTLVMRVDLAGEPSLRELVARVRNFALEAYSHQSVPFECLVESLQPVRSPARHPLFQVMLVLQNAPEAGLELPGLKIQDQPIPRKVAIFDLTLRLYEKTSSTGEPLGIEGDLEYSHDLFEPSTAETMRARLERLARWSLANADVPLQLFEILSTEERHALLEVFSPALGPTSGLTITDRFEEQVNRTPSAVAVAFGRHALTYAELNERANRLAHYLLERGVGPEMRVAVCLERSLEMIVAILGTLKAGGAYVPLDPGYPIERLGFMLDDSNAPVLLTQSGMREKLPAGWIHVIEMDADWNDIVLQPDRNPACMAGPSDAAYVIYTSGSTGQPKGVLVPHEAVVRLVVDQNYVTLDSSCRLLQLAPLSFDAATFEIWGALLNGGSLAIMPPGRASVQEIGDTLRREKINALWLTAGLFHEMVDNSLEAFADVRQLLAGGDVLSGIHVELLRNAMPHCRVINGYGPTENTTFTACYPVPEDADVSHGVPIGFPICCTRVYVLDENLELVPAGMIGELFTAGIGLARGYINQPGLTAERFIPNPFGVTGSRMYRTGDLVRWRADGALEFIGRADQQVKVRGYRVELGEIESVLARHPSVAQVAVIGRENQPGEKRLVGYVVPASGHSADPGALTDYLSQTLPDYMVPSALVMLDSLPLTVNGKIDRKALPSPDLARESAGRKPRNELERVLCGIFADVLSLPSVDIDDNFFTLGGHSLLATRLVSRARVTLGVELPLQSIFEWPTVAELSLHLGDGKARRPLQRQKRPDRMPLSFAQQRLWFLYRMEGPNPTYNIPMAMRLRGDLDADALAQALMDVVARHETLRTIFPEQDGHPFQHIVPAEVARPALIVEDVDDSRLAERLQAAAATCIHLEREIPLRAWLFRVRPDCHVLLFLLHHIAGDGWSLMPLANEIQHAYGERNRAQAPVFIELPVQYADYALWQRDLLGDENDSESLAAQQLKFWRDALAGTPEELTLPADHPRPAVASYRGEILPVRLSADLHRALLQLAREQGASLFMVLQAALAALLSRLGAGEDIPIGTVIAGRGEESLAELVGFFVNTLVMRTDVSGDPTFVELLQRVRNFALKAYAHQDVPFERLVELLRPLRSLSRHPLFQVMLVLQNSPFARFNLPGLTIDPEPLHYTIAKFDLTLRLDERLGANGEPLGMDGDLEFSSDLFNRATAEKIVSRFLRLLEGAAANPNQPLHCFDILTSAERRALLEEFNAVMPSAPALATLTELFEAQATRTPDAIAVTSGVHALTYAQLNQKANRLAHSLVRQGVRPESLVGIALERSLEMVVAVLATLKAGAAYLPLDPEYPEARLKQMLTDAAPAVVISTSALRSHVKSEIRLLFLDALELEQQLDPMPIHNPGCAALPQHPAYVIYTSGSTGTPKGVVVTHSNVVRLFDATRHWFSFGSQDVWTLFHSYAFDFSVWEIWGALLHGGRLVIVPKSITRSPSEFLKLLAEERITILNQTPSAFYQLMEADKENQETSGQLRLRTIIFGGEALELPRLRAWYERHADHEPVLVNMYGITETTVHVSYFALTEQMARSKRASLIGGNIPDLKIYVLDAHLQLVPTGVPGEMYVAGAGLARGYLNRPDLTSNRFVADPFGPPGTRMYRTGDLARWLDNGTLEYLGRVDQQVKIRGFRIELGEIEAALKVQEEVAQAVVIARDDGPDGKQLVAYVVPARDAVVDPVALRRALGERLPDYMVPAACVVLDALPLTTNGKLDRKSLPAPWVQLEGFCPPRTPQEEILCSIFSQVLSVGQVGINDSFFDLGGHSLLATRLVSQVRSALGVELSIRTLFEAPTVAELAEQLQAAGQARNPLVRVPRPERLPLSYAQQRLWFVHRLEGPNPTYNIPAALRMHGSLDTGALEQALCDVIGRHEILRTILPEHDGVPYQLILSSEEACVSLSAESITESQLRPRLAEVGATPIYLEREIPLKARLFRVDAADHVLMLVLHHIAGDGWSLWVFGRELEQAYRARSRGHAPHFQELPVQYADYALWQRELLGDENDPLSVVARQMVFWRAALAGAPEELSLPVDRPRPALPSYRGKTLRIEMDRDLHQSLLKIARQHGASLFMVLHAGLAALFSRLGAGEDVVIGTVVAGRGESAIEGLVGFFVNTLALRIDLSGNPSFSKLIHRVRSFALEAYANQDLPFEQLVEELQPARSMARHPLVQAMLILQNAPEANLGLPWTPIEVESLMERTAKYDLSLSLAERLGPKGEPQGIEGYLECSLELFDVATAERIIERWLRLLRHAAGVPEAHLYQLEFLTPQERHQLLTEFNDTATNVSNDTFPDLFEAQARRTPDATAVVAGTKSLTYLELNERSNQLAHYLISHGIGPESLVGIALERSPQMIVAVMGVLKAGAAYLPLDPEYPQARLEHIMNDSVPALVLTTGSLAGHLPRRAGTQVVALDTLEIEDTSHLQRDRNPHRSLLPQHPAYVIYTSGSTGAPKGAVITHAGIPSLAHAQTGRLQVGGASRVLQFASLNFDASLWEMVMAFTSGATLVLASHERSGSPLRDLLASQKVTHALLPLGVLATLEEAGEIPVECLINGGEALPGEVVARWSQGRRMINAYGPTEATVCATMSEPLKDSPAPPIGSPVTNTSVYVLDAALQPVPVGTIGELYISSLGLARGYLNRPALTAERFVANPHSNTPGTRMYRTGDLARWRSDETLDCMGRADTQIKVRGFRIELGEIETALKSVPGVSQVAVTVHGDTSLEKQLVAYIVPLDRTSIDTNFLQKAIQEKLPAYMVPSAFVVLDALPLLPNGKLDRKSLPPPAAISRNEQAFAAPNSELERHIAEIWQDVLRIGHAGIHDNFFELGGHSLLLARVHSRLQKLLGEPLPMVKLFEYPTIASLASYLELRETSRIAQSKGGSTSGKSRRHLQSSDIAIIGMALRFPGSRSVEAFWENLKQGVESITALPREALSKLSQELTGNRDFVNAGGWLEDVDLFDAALFGLSPAEAAATDPQQRLMLECAWEAIERAGYNQQGKSIGVFAGSGESLYRSLLENDQELVNSVGAIQVNIGTSKDHLAPRLSYLLDLRGPSVPVNTACSTSLVAVHLACQSLINFECDMALAGGVSLGLQHGYVYEEGSILSPDGRCRAFDASARGTVPGSGAGVVLLKRLEDALAAGDLIHAVIKGSAINNDGNAKVGYTAPSVEGQREVIERALANADVRPEEISYIEAHGTGTPLGDPIEIEALRQVFKGKAIASCAIGSVKTNIGHLDSAAGVAGLIKAVLCLEKRTLVPSLHFEQSNPHLDLVHSPFYVSTQTKSWESPQRFAGVSSFGIGGTNAHVVLAEAPQSTPSGPSREWQVLTLSAQTEIALEQKKTDLHGFLKINSEIPLADVALTLNTGHKPLPVRQSLVCSGNDELLASLVAENKSFQLSDRSSSVVFLFPGQGKTYTEFGYDLYQREPYYRVEVDRCSKRLVALIGKDLRELLFAQPAVPPEQLQRPLFWQPAIFVVEYALAQLWMSWGIKPAAMIGHSLGEYVAATLAGVLELNDALALVAERARRTEALEAGAMLAIPVAEARIRPYIKDSISLAAVNAPELCVLAGPVAEIDRLERELAALSPMRLQASHAFHSPLVEPIMEPLTRLTAKLQLRPPRIPYVSNVTGTWIRDEEATAPDYWARHVRETVRFADGLAEIMQKPGRVLLEVGPGKVLSDLAQRSFPECVALQSLRPGEPDGRSVAATLGRLSSEGIAIDWPAYYKNEKRRRVTLPAYPFERKSYWVSEEIEIHGSPRRSLAVKESPDNWLYASTWKRATPFGIRLEEEWAKPRSWLVFGREEGISASLLARLRHLGQQVTEVLCGAVFHEGKDGSFVLDPRNPRDYELLFESLRATGNLWPTIIHDWSGGAANGTVGFDSLIYLAQALGASAATAKIRLAVLTNNVHRVLDETLATPAQAAALGGVHVLPKENPRLICQNIDVDLGHPNVNNNRLCDAILAELILDSQDPIVALRHGHRWLPIVEQIKAKAMHHNPIARGGTYLITYPQQELGLALAERLVVQHRCRVVLLDRKFFPQPDEWPSWIADQGEDDPISRKISRLAGIREHLRVMTVDLANRERMMKAKNEIERELGSIAGVFHLEKPAKTGLIQGKSSPASSGLHTELAELAVLEELFPGVDFLALLSSNLAESGGLGQIEQATRNAVLNCLSQQLTERGKRAVTIELGTRGWREADEDNPDSGSFIYQQLEEKRQRFGMKIEECLDIMMQALNINSPGVIVSTRDFAALMEQQHLFTTDFFQHQMEQSSSRNGASNDGVHLRPDVSTAYEPPRSEVEKLLVEVWRSAFRFEQIGIHDNFFELGGHSLLAVQVLKNMNETFSSRLALKDLFDAPVIAKLAPLISGASTQQDNAEALEALLAEIEGMSEERLQAELNSTSEKVRSSQ